MPVRTNIQLNPIQSFLEAYNAAQDRQARAKSNELANQLQQLQIQTAQETLKDRLDPSRAIARDLNAQLTAQSLNPASGVVPVSPDLVGQTIARPGALTDEQVSALESGVSPESLDVPRGTNITPILGVGGVPTGFSRDLESAIRGATEQAKLNEITEAPKRAARLAEVKARYEAMGVPVRVTEDEFGNVQVIPTRMVGGVTPTASPVKTETGEQLKAKPKAGTGALTQNQQILALRKAGEAGINPDDDKYLNPQTGTYDFTKLTIDSGKALRENKRLADAAKASSMTGKTKSDLDALNAAEKQLHFLQDEITDIASSGKTPSFFDNVIAASTAAPPEGAIGAIYQQIAKGLQSEESKELEGRKSIISSALTKAISGLAVTKSEASRLGFIPRPGDTFEELVRKASLVQEYINNQRSGLGQASSSTIPSSTTTSGSKVDSLRSKYLNTP